MEDRPVDAGAREAGAVGTALARTLTRRLLDHGDYVEVSIVELLIIAVALGADAFSVAVGVGTSLGDWGSRIRLSLAFGIGQVLMPAVGWTAGAAILPYVTAYDHWVAFGVLTAISAKMMWESFRDGSESDRPRVNPTRSWMLPALALAVSIDALAVGFTMGNLDSRRIIYAIIIGVTASIMTLLGVLVARRATHHWGTWAERAGAVLLLGVAIKMLAV